MNLIIVESPYKGATGKNIRYARAAIRDSLLRGEAPLASHLLYTQPGVLDDDVAEERAHGITAGLAWGRVASLTAVYTDLGISRGMRQGIERAREEGRPVVYRSLEDEAIWTEGPVLYYDPPNCEFSRDEIQEYVRKERRTLGARYTAATFAHLVQAEFLLSLHKFCE